MSSLGAIRLDTRWIGMRHLRPGFCHDGRLDAAFAVGFPHLRGFEPSPAGAPDVEAITGAPTFYAVWPEAVGRPRARILALGGALPTPDGLHPPEARPLLERTAPFETDEARALVRDQLAARSPVNLLETLLFLEADLGSAELITVLVEALESWPFLAQHRPSHAPIGTWLGLGLLRVDAEAASALKPRLQALLPDPAVEGGPHSVAGALDRALNGREGAERNGQWDDGALHPSSLWFVQDDPAFVTDHVTRHHDPPLMFAGDARVSFLGGPQVLEYFVRRWLAVSPPLRLQMLEDFGPIADPLIVELMVMASDQPDCLPTVTGWFAEHQAFAVPILRTLAGGTKKRMAAGAARWLRHIDALPT